MCFTTAEAWKVAENTKINVQTFDAGGKDKEDIWTLLKNETTDGLLILFSIHSTEY